MFYRLLQLFYLCEEILYRIMRATTINILNNQKITVKFIFIFVSTNVEQNSTMLCKVVEAGYPFILNIPLHIKQKIPPSY